MDKKKQGVTIFIVRPVTQVGLKSPELIAHVQTDILTNPQRRVLHTPTQSEHSTAHQEATTIQRVSQLRMFTN